MARIFAYTDHDLFAASMRSMRFGIQSASLTWTSTNVDKPKTSCRIIVLFVFKRQIAWSVSRTSAVRSPSPTLTEPKLKQRETDASTRRHFPARRRGRSRLTPIPCLRRPMARRFPPPELQIAVLIGISLISYVIPVQGTRRGLADELFRFKARNQLVRFDRSAAHFKVNGRGFENDQLNYG